MFFKALLQSRREPQKERFLKTPPPFYRPLPCRRDHFAQGVSGLINKTDLVRLRRLSVLFKTSKPGLEQLEVTLWLSAVFKLFSQKNVIVVMQMPFPGYFYFKVLKRRGWVIPVFFSAANRNLPEIPNSLIEKMEVEAAYFLVGGS